MNKDMSKQKAILKRVENIKRYFERESIYRQLRMTTVHVIPNKRKIKFELNVGGGSYTDGKKIVVGLPEFCVQEDMPKEEVFSILKALAGHESEHIVSSDFVVVKDFQTKVADYFHQKYGFHNMRNIAHHVLNSVEDGRIERRLSNRLRGFKKHLQFLNGSIWKRQPIDATRGELSNFLYSITSYCVTGLFPKGFADVYGGSRMEEEINKVIPLIQQGIVASTNKLCADICWDIILTAEEYIVELMQDAKNQETANQEQNYEYTTSESDESQNPGNSVSTHFEPKQKDKEDDNKEEQQEDESGSDSPQQQQSDESNESGEKGDSDEEDGNSSSQTSEESDEAEDDSKGKGSKDDESDEEGDDSEEQMDAGNPDEGESNTKSDQSSDEGNDNEQNSNSSENNADNNLSDNNSDQSQEDAIDSVLNEAKKDIEEESKQALDYAEREDRRAEEIKLKLEAEKKKYMVTQQELEDIEKATSKNGGMYTNNVSYKDSNYNKGKKLPEPIEKRGKKFKKEVESIFQNKASYTRKNKRRGVLDTQSLWKVGVKDYNTFVKKGIPQDSDYVVYILLDGSGSMTEYGNGNKQKFTHAMEACMLVEEGIKDFVPFKIAMFTATSSNVNHIVISDFSDTGKENLSVQSTETPRMAGNKDGYNIRIAHKELMKRPERNKLLIVLSDGQPSAYHDTNSAIKDVKEAVDGARKDGVDVVSIFFGSEDMRRHEIDKYKVMYDKGIVSCEPEKIPTELIRVLNRTLKK